MKWNRPRKYCGNMVLCIRTLQNTTLELFTCLRTRLVSDSASRRRKILSGLATFFLSEMRDFLCRSRHYRFFASLTPCPAHRRLFLPRCRSPCCGTGKRLNIHGMYTLDQHAYVYIHDLAREALAAVSEVEKGGGKAREAGPALRRLRSWGFLQSLQVRADGDGVSWAVSA